MKIIAHGKENIGEAVRKAETALALGVQEVVIKCVPAVIVAAVSPGTLAYCPVTECSECGAAPCPFGHKTGEGVSRKLCEAATHG